MDAVKLFTILVVHPFCACRKYMLCEHQERKLSRCRAGSYPVAYARQMVLKTLFLSMVVVPLDLCSLAGVKLQW